MKTRTESLANDWGLQFVEITQGMNGYPQGLYKAIEGFDSFEDAESFADEVNGEVVLLSRRDGHQFWKNNGRQYDALERAKFIDENDEEMFTSAESFESWAMSEIESMIGAGDNIYDIKNASTDFVEICYAIYDMNEEREMCIVQKCDRDYEIVDKYATKIHDDDVTTYMIAVVDHETDEDETNEEEED